MKTFIALGISVCAMFSTLPLAHGQSNSYANAEKVGSISLIDGVVLNCRQTRDGDSERIRAIERLYTHIEFDDCLWTSSVNTTDMSAPVTLYRAGAETSCVLEEFEAESIPELDEQLLPMHLRSKGLDEVSVISTRKEKKFGGTLMHQAIRALMPFQGLNPERPVYGVRAWIWSDSARLTTFSCLGPEVAMEAEYPAIEAILDSIAIKPVLIK
jgi:hypothetical protein